jgi:hypothetical protein
MLPAMSVPALSLLSLDDPPSAATKALARAAAALGAGVPVPWSPHQAGAADAPSSVLVAAEPAALLAWLAGPGAGLAQPLSLFGPPPDAAQTQALLAAGVCGCWPAPEALPPGWLAAALRQDRARWQAARQVARDTLRLQTQLDERKWVDRAKGVLMNARGMPEGEAFALLRGAAMQANLRVGEVSRGVAEAAQWADALNRAGQLRMLSQRLVRLAAQRGDEAEARRARSAQDEALARLADNLGQLRALAVNGPSVAPWCPALQAVEAASQALREALAVRLGPAMLQRADAAADALLDCAEALIAALEAASGRRALHIVNQCGRQRMRVQRVAKQALLAQRLDDAARRQSLPALLDDFETALRELEQAPLSTPQIRADLAASRDEWLRLLRGLHTLDQASGRQTLVQAADQLLALFERLTAAYEHSLQVIMS